MAPRPTAIGGAYPVHAPACTCRRYRFSDERDAREPPRQAPSHEPEPGTQYLEIP